MNSRFSAARDYFRFLLDLFMLKNNVLFYTIFLCFVPLMLTGRWSLYALFFLVLFRNWIIIRKYCSQIHDFPVFFISTPYTPFIRLVGIFSIILAVFPLLQIILLLLFYTLFSLSGLLSFQVSVRFFPVMLGQLISWSSIMFFAALYWKSGQFKKLVSVLLAIATVFIVFGFLYIRSKYSEYFSSFFIFSDLQGFLESVNKVSDAVRTSPGPVLLLLFVKLLWYLLVPVLMFRFSLVRMKNLAVL